MFVNPLALTHIGGGGRYYMLLCVLLGVMIVLVYFLFPETKGRTLEEITEVFQDPCVDVVDEEAKTEQAHVEHEEEPKRDTTKIAQCKRKPVEGPYSRKISPSVRKSASAATSGASQ
jgi:hypothetical protein